MNDDDLELHHLIGSDKTHTVQDTVTPDAITISRLRAEYGDARVHQMIAQARLDIVEGRGEAESAETNGLSVEVVRTLRDAVVLQEKLILRRTPEETFIDFVLRQEGCVRELDALIPILRAGDKSAPAAVTAIKTKSDIFERVLKMGQELDLITKAPKRHEHTKVDGLDVSGLSDPALRQLALRVLGRFQKLVTRYGEFEAADIAPPQDPHLSRAMPESRRIAGRGADRARAARIGARAALVERVRGTSNPE